MITLRQYQSLYAITKSELDEWDRVTESVAVVTGKTSREVEDMPVMEFNTQAKIVTDILTTEIIIAAKKIIEVNGRSYGILYEPSKLTRGQYVTIQHFLQGDLIDNCHLIMASLTYNPKTKKHEAERHNEIAEDFKDVDFAIIYSACVFFCDLFKTFIKSLQDYLVKETKMNKMEVQKILGDFSSVMDGFIPQSKLQNLKG